MPLAQQCAAHRTVAGAAGPSPAHCLVAPSIPQRGGRGRPRFRRVGGGGQRRPPGHAARFLPAPAGDTVRYGRIVAVALIAVTLGLSNVAPASGPLRLVGVGSAVAAQAAAQPDDVPVIPTQAQPPADGGGSPGPAPTQPAVPLTPEAQDRTGLRPLLIGPEDEAWLATFITGNTLFVFFHELGHALVSEYDIPILGQEEDAVDQLAALILIDWRRENELATDFLFAVADAWAIRTQLAETRGAETVTEPAPSYRTHSLDRQRFDNVLCLLYGSDPTAFALMLMEGDLTHQRAAGCPRMYWQASAAWNQALKSHIRNGSPASDATGETPADGRFLVRYRDGPDSLTRRWKPFVQRTGVFESLAGSLSARFRLAQDITIRLTACGQDNAYWDASRREIIVCYEMMEGFAELALAALRR